MEKYYTVERDAQILIQLLKEHGIKKIVASPGTTNFCFVGSVQNDPYFEIYSCIDERSAAYIACGLSAESGEPVAISCTGATASRNYMSGLTEAYYRHLPILAITATQSRERVGHNIPQVIDRSVLPKDIAKMSIQLPFVYNSETEWSCIIKVNSALLELTRHGGGPVHIDLPTEYNTDFSMKTLPKVRKINRYFINDIFPEIKEKKIAIFVGAHNEWTNELTKAVEHFCDKFGAVVLCDQTSNYWGKYRCLSNLLFAQLSYHTDCKNIDLLIHIGEVSGCYMSLLPEKVWRVHPDGEIRDTFGVLDNVFEMKENEFFNYYINSDDSHCNDHRYQVEWESELIKIRDKIPEVPFSNVWVASKVSPKIPTNSIIHFGILNSLRSWNYFETTKGTLGYSNTGGFGIDGGVSSLIGGSFSDRNRLHFGIVGDLAFFYDMNSLGNRDIGNNLRLIIVNNGRGTEFRNSISYVSVFGEEADRFIAAAGHFGNKSKSLIKHFAQDLGFEYMSASTKDEFLDCLPQFVDSEFNVSPIILEVFTTPEDENEAIEKIYNIEKDVSAVAKEAIKGILGKKGTDTIKKIFNH